MANVIVVGEGATFNDLPHFAGGIAPEDGIHTVWRHRAGSSLTEAFLMNSQPLRPRPPRPRGSPMSSPTEQRSNEPVNLPTCT